MINKNRYITFIITLIMGVIGWYNLILFTSKEYLPIPDTEQYKGLIIGLVLSVLYWLRQCYTIKLD